MKVHVVRWVLACAFVMLFTNVLVVSCGGKESSQVGRITVLISGNTDGYLKNCGCSAGQFGGAGRMARMMSEEEQIALKSQATDQGLGHAVLLVDTGNIIDATGTVKKIESAAILEIMATLPYDSVGIGFKELRTRQNDLLELLESQQLPYTAANLAFVEPKDGDDLSADLNALIKPYRIITDDNGYKIGVIHVLDQTYVRSLNMDLGFQVTEAHKAVEAVLSEHRSEADFWVVTVADGVQGSARPAEISAVEGVGAIIGFERYTPPADLAGKLPVYADPPYRKSRDIVRLTVKFDSQGAFSSSKVDKLQLQEELKPTQEALAIIDSTQPLMEAEANRLAQEKVSYSGPHPWYVGQTQCAMCHSDIALMLQETKHIHAYETLVAKDQHRSAACLPCHVVGYDTPDRGGFNVFEKEPQTQGVKCENCHGPGEYHVAMMSGEPAPPDATENGRNASGLLPVVADESACISCHDTLNSVGFDFDVYWPRIRHGRGQSPDLTDNSDLGGSPSHMTEEANAKH